MTTCPKCHYTRQPGDATPEYECPKCGVVYAKAQPVSETPLPSAWANKNPEIAPPDAYSNQKLTACPCCATPISFAATMCPKCGHPNPEVTNRAGITAGIIAIALGISSIWAPYFAAPLLIPAALAALAIGLHMRSHPAMLICAAVLIAVAGIQTYQTSDQIRKAADAAEESAKRSARELELFQERLRREQARSQEELERTLRSLR